MINMRVIRKINSFPIWNQIMDNIILTDNLKAQYSYSKFFQRKNLIKAQSFNRSKGHNRDSSSSRGQKFDQDGLCSGQFVDFSPLVDLIREEGLLQIEFFIQAFGLEDQNQESWVSILMLFNQLEAYKAQRTFQIIRHQQTQIPFLKQLGGRLIRLIDCLQSHLG
ncbi:unnamed protein product [Paramecium primaurelia]|uniref:Uncharacterized protein n=1 Tax=Paramecium primaurelia TaxID=5886 RepID=A0A8S1KW56_PARPR|nr:unnamed protein product [Paramecium primaurelia]